MNDRNRINSIACQFSYTAVDIVVNKVEQWGSECTCINYFNPVDQKNHRYFPDFVVQMNDGAVMIVEIKPENQTKTPDCENSWAMRTYAVNSAKWKEINRLCEEKGYKFCILTEHTICRL